VKVLEMQLDVVATERERIEVLAEDRASRRSSSSSPTSPRPASSRPSRSTRTRAAYEGLARCYRRLRQWHDLINTYDRHINATIDRPRSRAVARWPVVYSDELEDVEKRDRRVPQHRRHRGANIPALEALAKLYEKQGDIVARHRLHDARRRAHDRRQAARRDVLPHRPQLDEKLGDRVSAQDRYEMALDLDPSTSAVARRRSARSRWTRPTGIARRGTSTKSR
jgi:tetratricopeptide (TPR) repeat protein